MLPPPGYPFEGPLPSCPPPPRETEDEEPVSPIGLAGFFLAFVALMMGTGFLIVALLLTRARAREDARLEVSSGAMEMPSSMELRAAEDGPAGGGTSKGTQPSSALVLPSVERNVPTYPVRLLEGCSDADLHQVEAAIEQAVRVGVPLYNDGDASGCYDAYESHAHALESALPATCRGPVEELASARRRAAAVAAPHARAWALRDAFDGLLEVIERSRANGVPSL